MVSRSLFITAVLLCVAAGLASAQDSKVKTDIKKMPYCYCPKGYVLRYLGSIRRCQCYKFVRDLASWAEAKVYCGVIRARMVEVKDQATHSWLQWQLYSRKSTFHHHGLEKAEYWLGATDLELEKRWVWDPSNTAVVPGFEHWLPNEPNNYLGYQNCMAIRRRCWDMRCIDYGWFDDDCYQKKFYICEKRGRPLLNIKDVAVDVKVQDKA